MPQPEAVKQPNPPLTLCHHCWCFLFKLTTRMPIVSHPEVCNPHCQAVCEPERGLSLKGYLEGCSSQCFSFQNGSHHSFVAWDHGGGGFVFQFNRFVDLLFDFALKYYLDIRRLSVNPRWCFVMGMADVVADSPARPLTSALRPWRWR